MFPLTPKGKENKEKTMNNTKKYEMTDETKKFKGIILRRIRALRDIPKYGIKAGDLGGWIEAEHNLLQYGDAWVHDDAKVYGCAKVHGDARVFENAVVCEEASIYGEARLYDNARVYGDARVSGRARVYGCAKVYGNAEVHGYADVYDYSSVYGNATVYDNADVCNYAKVSEDAEVFGDTVVADTAQVFGDAIVSGNAMVRGDALVSCNEDYMTFKNSWSSGRWFTYTRSNKMWSVGCFYGIGDELIRKAYADSELIGKCYEAIVRAVEAIEKAKA